MTDVLDRVEAVLADLAPVTATAGDNLIHATYPEALAVVRDYEDVARQAHGLMHYRTWEVCEARLCVDRRERIAAYLAKAQEYVPVQEARGGE